MNSNFKGTPGPWKATFHETLNTRELACIENVGYDGEPSGLHLMVSYLQEKDVNRANAKLIAAAPELLEALVELKKWVGKLQDWNGQDPPCELVDNAIKKATGHEE